MFLLLTIFSFLNICVLGQNENYLKAILSPKSNCLPYDGSVIPDCRDLIDPDIRNPVFVEHSTSKQVSILFYKVGCVCVW